MQNLHDPFHQRRRTGGPRHDARSQTGEIDAVQIGMLQLRREHRRDTMQGRAAFRLHGAQHRQGIKMLGRNDDTGTHGQAHEIGQDHPETVEKRDGHA